MCYLKFFQALFITLAFFVISCSKTPETVESKKVLSSACQGEKIHENTVNTSLSALVSSDYNIYPPSCFENIISKTLSSSNKPFVLFIHGRGQHPSKALNNKLISKIEKQYDVSVLMFTWPSWSGYLSFPEQKADESSKVLLSVLKVLQAVKNNRNDSRTLSLLTHSMGSLVVEAIINSSIHNLQNDLFDNIVFSSSASASDNHVQWVDQISFAKNIYITANIKDQALACIENDIPIWKLWKKSFCSFFDLSERLGHHNDYEKSLLKKVKYMDFSKYLDTNHRYYINQKGKANNVFNFYNNVFHGQNNFKRGM